MAKSAKKEVAVKESPIQSHLKGEATNKRVAGATRKAKQIGDAISVIFYKAHFESKGLAVNVSINPSRGEIKSDAVDASQTEQVKKAADGAKGRFRKFTDWCRLEFAGKFKEKDPNNRQSSSKNKKSVQEIVQDHGQRCYNACYKNDLKQASVELQAWATKWFKSKIKYAVPAGQK